MSESTKDEKPRGVIDTAVKFSETVEKLRTAEADRAAPADTKAEDWRIERAKRMNSNASAPVPAYRTRELESALQQIKDTTEGSRCVDCEAIHVVASDAMSYVPARAAAGDEAYFEKLLQKVNEEWAETDTAIRELCRPFTDVEGDSYGVPTLVEIVEKTIAALRTPRDKPDIFVDALASQIDAVRRAAFDEAIAIVKAEHLEEASDGQDDAAWDFAINYAVEALERARDATPTDKPRSDKGHHHRVAGVLQEDVDEAEN